jgi:hypothetical protein
VPKKENTLWIFSSSETWIFFSKLIIGAGFRFAFVEVLERTLGHAGAAVSAARRSKSSETGDPHCSAAAARLQRVIEKPGPFNTVSKLPEYIFVGLMLHVVSRHN